MQKILAVARAEYLQAVRSKAFILGVLLMPLLMGGSVLAQIMLKDQVDLRDRRCAVLDGTGELFEVLVAANERRDAETVWRAKDDGERQQVRPRFLLELHVPADGERTDVELSRRVEAGELDGFLLVAPDVLDREARIGERPLSYHTDEPTFTELPNWLGQTVNREVRRTRFAAAELDQELVSRLDRSVPLRTFGLAAERSDGTVEEAEEENKARTFGVPAGAMFLLFMLIMTSAPALMNQVLEEKMQRIAEVLVSAVTPFQLMMGKLLGGVLVSLTLAALYLGAVVWATHYWGVGDLVPLSVYAWFVVFLVLALLMYGSMFSALGSACSELKDAQSMMMPAMILIMIPLFAWTAVLESPNGPVAQVLTFIPTATPLILLLRMVAPPGPPAWEVAAALVLCLAATVGMVWAGAKIFRVGMLSQGQAPSLRRVLGWVLSK